MEFNAMEFILKYECEDIEEEELIQGFQGLIDCGIVWQLQGAYGRMAADLINQGYCRKRG